MDLFDPKPALQRRSGQQVANIRGGNANLEQSSPLMGSPFRFRPYGRAGVQFSELVFRNRPLKISGKSLERSSCVGIRPDFEGIFTL